MTVIKKPYRHYLWRDISWMFLLRLSHASVSLMRYYIPPINYRDIMNDEAFITEGELSWHTMRQNIEFGISNEVVVRSYDSNFVERNVRVLLVTRTEILHLKYDMVFGISQRPHTPRNTPKICTGYEKFALVNLDVYHITSRMITIKK